MNENQQPFPVRHDEEKNAWIVMMDDRELHCHSEVDAQCIASLPVLYREASADDILSTNEQYRQAFCKRAKQLLKLVNEYGASCVASRAVERALGRVTENLTQ